MVVSVCTYTYVYVCMCKYINIYSSIFCIAYTPYIYILYNYYHVFSSPKGEASALRLAPVTLTRPSIITACGLGDYTGCPLVEANQVIFERLSGVFWLKCHHVDG